MKNYNEIKEKYPNIIILVELDDFYECYNDDAIKVSKVLGVILTKKNDAPYMNFKKSNLDLNLTKLVKNGNQVGLVKF